MFLTYEDFLISESNITLEDAKKRLLIAVAEKQGNQEGTSALMFFINEGFTNDLFDIATSVDESFAEKFKEMAVKAKEKVKELGKDAADKIGQGAKAALKFGGNIMGALKWVLGKIKDALGKMWEFVKGKAQAAVAAEQQKIEKELTGRLKNPEKRKTLKDEVKNLKDIGTSAAKFVGTDVIGMAAKSAETVATDESFQYNTYEELFEASFYVAAAETLEEGHSIEEAEKELLEFVQVFEGDHGDGTSAKSLHIPFIGTIMKKLSSVPPFNMLHKVEAMIAKGTEKGLNGFSQLATKAIGAPGPFTFPVMAGIVSIVAGYMIEQQVKKGLHSIDEILIKALGVGIPGFGVIYKFMKYGGIALATYGLVQNLLGKYEGDDKKEDKKEEN
jgi:hypothetical protein